MLTLRNERLIKVQRSIFINSINFSYRNRSVNTSDATRRPKHPIISQRKIGCLCLIELRNSISSYKESPIHSPSHSHPHSNYTSLSHECNRFLRFAFSESPPCKRACVCLLVVYVNGLVRPPKPSCVRLKMNESKFQLVEQEFLVTCWPLNTRNFTRANFLAKTRKKRSHCKNITIY